MGARLISETTQEASGIAGINTGDADVLGHNGARADDDMIADCNREHRGIRPDTYTVAKPCCPPKIPFRYRSASNEQVVNKHRAVRNEAVVANCNELTNKRVRLNPASLPDSYSLLYLYKRPDEATIANRASIEIDRLHDRDVFTKRYIDNR